MEVLGLLFILWYIRLSNASRNRCGNFVGGNLFLIFLAAFDSVSTTAYNDHKHCENGLLLDLSTELL